MSNDERDRLLGSLVRERADLNATVCCLKKKLHEYQEQLHRALQVVRAPEQFKTATYGGTGQRIVMLSAGEPLQNLPTASEVAEAVQELQDATARVETLNQQLGGMGIG